MRILDVDSLLNNFLLDDILASFQRKLLPEVPRLPQPTDVIRLYVEFNGFYFGGHFRTVHGVLRV